MKPDRRTHYSFKIYSDSDLFQKLEEEFKDLEADQSSSRHAINFAMTAWHLTDWIWAVRLKNNKAEQRRLFAETFERGKNGLNRLRRYLCTRCQELRVMQEITNGSKHLKSDSKDAITDTFVASTIHLDVSSGYGIETAPHTQVTLTNGSTVPFIDVARKVLEFWRSKF